MVSGCQTAKHASGRPGGRVSTEGKIKVVEELISIGTEKLKVVKGEYEKKKLAMASIVESLEADKKRLEQLKKEAANG